MLTPPNNVLMRRGQTSIPSTLQQYSSTVARKSQYICKSHFSVEFGGGAYSTMPPLGTLPAKRSPRVDIYAADHGVQQVHVTMNVPGDQDNLHGKTAFPFWHGKQLQQYPVLHRCI